MRPCIAGAFDKIVCNIPVSRSMCHSTPKDNTVKWHLRLSSSWRTSESPTITVPWCNARIKEIARSSGNRCLVGLLLAVIVSVFVRPGGSVLAEFVPTSAAFIITQTCKIAPTFNKGQTAVQKTIQNTTRMIGCVRVEQSCLDKSLLFLLQAIN